MPIFDYLPGQGPLHGRRGGNLFSLSRLGSIARAGTIPERDPTNRREARKSALCICSGRWRDVLTPVQKASWATLSAATTFFNALGDPYNPSARNLFIRTNSLRFFYALGFIDTAPALAVCPFYEKSFYYDSSSQKLSVSAKFGIPAAYSCFFDFSFPISPVTNYYRAKFSFNDDITGAAAASGSFLLPAGTFSSGDRISIRSRDMAADGSLSDPVYYIFDLEDSKMFVIQTSFLNFTLRGAPNSTLMWEGTVPQGATFPAGFIGSIIPVPCRLRHISIVLNTGLVLGAPPVVDFQFRANGVTQYSIQPVGTNVPNVYFKLIDTNIVGVPFFPNDALWIVLQSVMGPGEAIPLNDVIIDLFFEPGTF
ncbi:MAG: hypothetical protein KAT00_06830 [Planctomycetes bacterium]|nr:hypothetical protein [Planctomycetota bacterium]